MKQSNCNDQKLVLFDIDGTLIQGGHPILRQSYLQAIKKVFGIEILVDWRKHDGSIDRKIFIDILKDQGISEGQILGKLEDLFEERYNYFYQNVEEDYRKRLIKPAKNLVVKLSKRGINLGLLTGNLPSVARLKMEVTGLSTYFKFGLFGHEAEDRVSLAKEVFLKAKEFFGIKFLPENIYVIGDTVKDIECGKSIKARTIGVATGFIASLGELKKAKPDLAVKTLADTKVFKFIFST